MKEFKKLTPFKLQVLENFPFIDEDFDAITNYELLCKVVEYLNKTIGEVSELTDKVNEFQNYFDNLDVQEEINNKLDEMAESGELTEIIAQYLNLAGVLVYDTVADMKQATNLVNGSSVKTLGYNSINDGNGEYYKISNTLGYKGILLDNGLYANLVKEDKIPNFFLSMYFESASPWNDQLFVSLDGLNLTKLKVPFNLQGRDTCIKYNKVNKTFYVSTGALDSSNYDFTIYYSNDFINWNYKQINIGLQGNLKWAPDIFIEDDGTIRVIISNNYGTETDILGSTIPAFDMYYSYTTDLDNLVFANATKITLNGATNRNHIDGSLAKINGTYYLVCKDEHSKIAEIYSTINYIDYYIVLANVTGSTLPTEGQHLCVTENDVYFTAECYLNGRHIVSKTPLASFPTFNKFESVENLQGYKHGSMIYINDEYAKKLIMTASEEFSLYNNEVLNIPVTSRIKVSAGTDDFLKDGLVIFPNSVYYADGGGTITLDIVNIYDEDVMRFYFAGNNSLKLVIRSINGVTLNPQYELRNSRFLNEKMIEIPLKYNSLKFMNPTITELTTADVPLTRPNDLSYNWFHAYKVNGIVNISMAIRCNVTGYEDGQWFVLTTLPSGWRPPESMYFTNGNQLLGNRFELKSNGEINAFLKLNNGGYAPFSISYIAIN